MSDTPRQPIESAYIDYFLGLGIACDQLMRVTLARPDVEVRLWNGRLSVGYKDEPPSKSTGVLWAELTVTDWNALTAYVSSLPVRVHA